MRVKFIIFGLLACVLFSCDKIDAPYRVEQADEVNTDVVFPDLDTNKVVRKILIEEFTGTQCVNCPSQGHQPLATLLNAYGDTLVPVCVHAGMNAIPTTQCPYDFRTDYGTQLYSDLSISSLPCAVINRTKFQNKFAVNSPQWQAALDAIDLARVPAAIQVINKLKNNLLKVNVKVTMLEQVANKVVLMMVLTEDNIVAPQRDNSEIIENYVHRHALRTAINGNSGCYLSDDGDTRKDSAYTKSYLFDFANHDYNIANCEVVVFVYDAETQEVLQVERCPVQK